MGKLLQIDRHHHHRRQKWCPSLLFFSPSLLLQLRHLSRGSSAQNASVRCMDLPQWWKWGRSLSTTTSATTTAPHWTPPQLSTSARTPSPSTTSACSSPLSSTGLLMEPFMFARLLVPATPERPGVGGGLPGRPHYDRRVQDLPGAKLLPERLGRLQAAGGGALHRHAHHGHGEVLHPHRDLHARASVRRKPHLPPQAH